MRLHRADAFRLYAIFAIICAHTQLFDGLKHESLLATLIELVFIVAARCTMPFFFMTSGYFLEGKIIQEPTKLVSITVNYVKRIARIFSFWCVVYALERPLKLLNLVKEEPIRFFLEGTRVHLWFLVSLILTVWLFALWRSNKKSNYFLLLGVALYVVGLLGGSYKFTPMGFDLPFNTRNGVFFSTLFFAMGVAFRHRAPRVSKRVALCTAFVGLAIFCLEAYYLRLWWLMSPIRHDYLLGTVPFGVGIFLLALAHKESVVDRFVGPYAKYVLGIYASHMLFVDLWRPLGSFFDLTLWSVVFPVLVFGSSFLLTVVVSRTPLRRIVV